MGAVNTGSIQNVVTCILQKLVEKGCDPRENQNLVTFEWTEKQEARLIIGLSVNNPGLDGYNGYMYANKMSELTRIKEIMENEEDDASQTLVRIVQQCLSGSDNEYLRNLRINSHQVRLYTIGTGERVSQYELNARRDELHARLQNRQNANYYIPPRRLFPRPDDDYRWDYAWKSDTGHAGAM